MPKIRAKILLKNHGAFLPAAALFAVATLLTFSASAQQAPSVQATSPGAANLSVPGSAASSPSAMPINPYSNTLAQDPSAPGINIPSPPPASAFNNDPGSLAAQAEQAALQAQAQAEADQAKREREHNEKSFDRAESGILPLTPDQIHAFMKKLENTQAASEAPTSGPPKGQVRVATLSLDPGVEPPQLNVAAGYVTTINMVDASGEPWPILDVGVGGNYDVAPTQAGSHIVRVMPLTRVGTGNLSVLLKDLPTPVIFKLNSGGPTVDLRYDARIGKMGPGAKAPLISRPRLEAGNENMMMLLENAPPSSAVKMKVSGVDSRTRAWSMDSHVFVRTPLTLLSPAWDSSVSSADGMTVYQIGDAPILLMSDNGSMVRAQLARDEDHDKP